MKLGWGLLTLVIIACDGKLKALQQCRDALAAVAGGHPDVPSIYEACAARYRSPCREALVDAARRRIAGGIADAMLGTCRDTYCPELPDPKPAACLGSVRGREGQAVYELDAAILASIFGADRELAGRTSLFRTVTGPSIRVDLPRVTDLSLSAPSATIAIRPLTTGVTISYRGQDWTVGDRPTSAELAPLLDAIRDVPRDANVILECAEGVPHGAVVSVMNGLKGTGITKLAIAETSR